jgi:hypothetical protein
VGVEIVAVGEGLVVGEAVVPPANVFARVSARAKAAANFF